MSGKKYYENRELDPFQHKRKKKRKNGILIICIAFLAFFSFGTIIALSIRACASNKLSLLENTRQGVDNTNNVDMETENSPVISAHYSLPDSVIRICMPKSIDGISEQILIRSFYIVSYNLDTKIPNWVAWHLTAEHSDGEYPRDNSYYEDEEVPVPRATNEDYRGSGWSRGHMCPAGDNKWDAEAMRESNLLTNICPQHPSLNSGVWNVIERDCRKWAKKYGDIYIVCGPILMNREHETIGDNKIVVPEAFFKVILRLNPQPAAIGYVVRNNEGNKKRDMFVNTVDDVERITGIDFFPSLPDEIENMIESETDIFDWN